jgi:hypothetical protein
VSDLPAIDVDPELSGIDPVPWAIARQERAI